MNFILAILGLIPVLLAGDLLYRLLSGSIDRQSDIFLRFPVALALGTGAVSLILFYTSRVNVRNGYTVAIAAILVGSLIYIAVTAVRWRGQRRQSVAFGRAALTFFLGAAVVAILWFVSQRAGLGVDGYAHWGIKAKASFLDGGWILTREGLTRFAHSSYPLLVPSQQGWIYSIIGQVDEQAVKIIFVLYYLALGSLFYYAVRKVFPRILAILFTLLMMATPLLAITSLAAYADIPITFFLFGTVFFLFRWLDQGTIRDLVIGALFAGFMLLVKREGAIYWAVLFCFLLGHYLTSIRNRRGQVVFRQLVLFALIPFLIAGSWFILLQLTGIDSGSFESPSLSLLIDRRERILVLIGILLRELFLNYGAWGILWYLFLATTAWKLRKLTQPTQLLLWIAVALPIVLFSISFVFSVWTSYTLHADTALSRLILHTVPIAWLFIAYQSSELREWYTELRYGDSAKTTP